jgi:glutathione synthase/RimK-type ligase-like ATP-grasp enzyme
MIILCGSAADPHLARISAELAALGEPYSFLDHETPSNLVVQLERDRYEIRVDGRDLRAQQLVYYRTKYRARTFDRGPGDRERHVVEQGWRSILRNVLSELGDRVVNRMDAVARAERKLDQLRTAAALGLATPETLVSNDYAAVKAFLARHGRAIIKPLGDNAIPADDGVGTVSIMTTRVSEALLDANPSALATAPCFFQAEIAKRCEYRVCIQGDEVFAFHINSQESAHSVVDWRYGTMAHRFTPEGLPEAVVASLKAYLKATGLFAGHFDLALTPEGEFVFFECNPQGYWAWLDDVVDGRMSAAFARSLCERVRAQTPAPSLVE